MLNLDFNSTIEIFLMLTSTPREMPYGFRSCLVIFMILVFAYLIYHSFAMAEYYSHRVPKTNEEKKQLYEKRLEAVTWFFVYIYTSVLFTVCIIVFYLFA